MKNISLHLQRISKQRVYLDKDASGHERYLKNNLVRNKIIELLVANKVV